MKKLVCLALITVWLCGCAQVAPMMADVNWWKVGAYACIRLCSTLNRKADEKDKDKAQDEDEAE